MSDAQERIEELSEAVHQAYLDTCARLGWDVKPANAVPYSELGWAAQELDRASVRAVLARLQPVSPEPAPPPAQSLLEEAVRLLEVRHERHQTKEEWARICWPHMDGEVPSGFEYYWREPEEWCSVCIFLDRIDAAQKEASRHE